VTGCGSSGAIRVIGAWSMYFVKLADGLGFEESVSVAEAKVISSTCG
jgi:hypothetical protein